MKKHYFYIDLALFFSVFFIFILPCILNNSPADFSDWKFPWLQLLWLISAAFICFLEIRLQKNDGTVISIIKPNRFAFLPCSLTFIGLIVFSGILQLAAYKAGTSSINEAVSFPACTKELIFCILTFLFSAFFEELIFRFYVPAALSGLLKKIHAGKKFYPAAEIFTAVVFALCHRYMGFFSVLNALFAHFLLRFCFKKTGSIFCSSLTHFLYNITVLFFLFCW